jgi:xylulokinase
MVGGGANSDIWCQIHADVLNRTIKQVKNPIEANVRGVGLLAAVGAGLTTFAKINNDVAIARVWEPIPAHRGIYDELFASYEMIYSQNRRIYARLNRN